MQAQDVVSYMQTVGGDGAAGQRYSTAQYLQVVDRSQKLLVRDLKWPPSRFTFTTTPTVQEYQLQEVIKILAVYLNGQPLVRTDKATLEGRQLNYFDQTASGGGPGGLIVQNESPNLAGSTFTPQWTSQTAATYPVPSASGLGYGMVSPWFPGRRPSYYCNGGNIGFVPAPLGALTAVCDVVIQPVTVRNMTDEMILPDIALDAIAWKGLELLMFSDADQGAERRNYAMTQFAQAKGELRSWVRGYDGDANKGPIPLTYRSFYVRGQNRNGGP